MSKLEPVIYRNMNYPINIEASIHEVSGNFYKKSKLHVDSPYSLHTEPSFEPRTFDSKFVNDLEYIKEAQNDNIPQLWYNKKWAIQFFIFIDRLIESNDSLKMPKVLEIHPPFNNYCNEFDQFIKIFNVFYKEFSSKYPDTTILIENRFGSKNKSGDFLLSKCDDILNFCNILSNSNIDLKIALDYPQIFSAEINADGLKWDDIALEKEKILSFNKSLVKYRKLIGGIHMWGKLKNKKRWIPHAGNFDTFFCNNDELKHEFLGSVFSTFNDIETRYFVPEVHSGESDLHSIVADIKKEGFIFI